MSPRGLVRNVPLSLRPLRRSWSGADGDEYDRVAARRRVGAGRGGDVEVGLGGGIDGSELSPGEALVSTVPCRGREGPQASRRRMPLEPGDGTEATRPRPGVGP